MSFFPRDTVVTSKNLLEMKHPKPKPFAEKEIRLSGQFSFELLKTVSNLFTPEKKKLLHTILMIISITYLIMVLHFVNETKRIKIDLITPQEQLETCKTQEVNICGYLVSNTVDFSS